MGLLENSIGAMLGGNSRSSSGLGGGGSPYAPLATALIGMLAVKAASGGFGDLGSLFSRHHEQPTTATGSNPSQPAPQQADQSGGLVSGLGGLLKQFQQHGHGDVAQSWVGSGPNVQATPDQVSKAVGPDMIRELAQKMGIPESEVAARLSQELPEVVDKLTPQGRLPTQKEAFSWG